jgi:hypothetical protein
LPVALSASAVISAAVSAAIPTHAVVSRDLVFTNPPTKLAPRDPFAVRVGIHLVVIHPPEGFVLRQISEGDLRHAHVTMAAIDGKGGGIGVRFEVPDGIAARGVFGERDGTPVHDTRFGLSWRARDDLTILVSGTGVDQRVLLDVIERLEVSD